jgi:hypothetical protein
MKQYIETVSSSSANEFDKEVKELLKEGYKVQSTCISKREVGSYEEFSVLQAILLKETEE